MEDLYVDEWREGLKNLSGKQIKNGLGECRLQEWPPSMAEFVKLCVGPELPALNGAAYKPFLGLPKPKVDKIKARAAILQFPLILLDGKILDGRNRYRAACRIGEENNEPAHYYYYTIPYIGDNPIEYVLSLNLHRRHLSASQRALIAAEITNTNKGTRPEQGRISPKIAGDILNVPERTVKTAKRVIKNGVPELKQRVEDGDVSLGAAEEIAKLPEEEQKTIVEEKREKKVATEKRKEKTSRVKIIAPYDLFTIEIVLCEFCLNGEGGYCQSPGCGLYKRQSPDFALDQFSTITKNTVNE
jgi:hypothetical protein